MQGDVTGEVEELLDDNPEMSKAEAWAHAYRQNEGDTEKRAELAKSAPNGSITKLEFELSTEGSVGSILKADDDYIIWGPASVEVVDKEDDRIKASALKSALPQLLKRKRLSYEHSDQIVGDILKNFETEEPIEVSIDGKTFERSEFPTDVLELDGLKPGLYVAGNIYNDTQKSQEVRKLADEGEIDSYSISGEAIVTEMAVKNGKTFTDILKMDLSAVTLCREGMNQKAKFDIVSKWDEAFTESTLNPQKAASLAKSRISKTMGSNNDNDDVEKFVDALDKTLDERLPDGELATKGDVEDIVDERLKAQEGSPTDGTPERPDGNSDTPTNQGDPYEGDSDEWGEDPTDDSDKVEETKSGTSPSSAMREFNRDPEEREAEHGGDEKKYTTDELKSMLPDDQFKAIEPLLDEEDEPDVDPAEEQPDEMVDEEMPDEDPMAPDEEGEPDPVMAAKAVENLDMNRLDSQTAMRILKAQESGRNVEKTDSAVRTSPSVAGGTQPAHAGQTKEKEVAKADGDAVDNDPALRQIYDDDGTPQI